MGRLLRWTIFFFINFACLLKGIQPWTQTYKYNYGDEKLLLDSLLSSYDRRFRPISPTHVLLIFYPFSLNNLDIGAQQVSVTGAVVTMWHDSRLTWTPSQHANISELLVPYESLWVPKPVVENTVDDTVVLGSDGQLPIRVLYDGTAICNLNVNIKFTCQMRSLAFPFDTQRCHIIFSLWALNDLEAMFYIHEKEQMPLQATYNPNGEWDLTEKYNLAVTRNYYGIDYTRVHVNFVFRRKWVFLTLTLIVPAILNSLLMSLVFSLPFECGEKISYALTVLLTYIVLLTLVTSSLPPISVEVSILQIYLTCVMCTGTVATILTCWTVTIYNRDPDIQVPRNIVTICQTIRPCLKPVNLFNSKKCQSAQNVSLAAKQTPFEPDNKPHNGNDHGLFLCSNCETLKPSPFPKGVTKNSYTLSKKSRIFPETAFENNCVFKKENNEMAITSTNECITKDATETNSLEDNDATAFNKYRKIMTDKLGRFGHANSYHQHTAKDAQAKEYNFEARKDTTCVLTWKDVAESVDYLCFWIISGVVVSGTVAMIIFFMAVY